MSEHVVHTAILLDSLRLISALDQVDPDFRQTLERYRYFALRGCVTVSGDTFSYRLLEELKARPRPLSGEDQAVLAFTVGWVSHRACDRIMKPIWKEAPFKGRGTDVDPNISPFECSIYHEAEAYRRYFSEDRLYPAALFPERLSQEMPAGFRQETAETLIGGGLAANLMQIQTIPDTLHDQERFEEICMRIQKFYVGLHRYRRAITAPDPVNYEEFVTKIDWYDENDPILRAALALARGEALSSAELLRLIGECGGSYYAKALALSTQYILSADRYIRDGALDTAWLRGQLDIGKLGPGGLAV